MKKHLLPFALSICVVFGACNTTQKLFEAQAYDEVILKEAPRACEGRTNANKIGLLAASYHRANQADHERIQALKSSGQPDVWPEIYERYSSMKGRNEALSCLPTRIKNDINYVPLDLDEELKASQNKAEAYLAAKVNRNLNEEHPNLEETDRLIKHLESINPNNTQIADLKIKSLGKRYGDLSRLVHFDIHQRQVSPDKEETVTFKETNGSATAMVTDHVLSKTATVKGKLNFIDPESKRMLLSLPFEASSNFNHSYTTLEGDSKACSEQTLARLKQQPVPFPTDQSMIEDAVNSFMKKLMK